MNRKRATTDLATGRAGKLAAGLHCPRFFNLLCVDFTRVGDGTAVGIWWCQVDPRRDIPPYCGPVLWAGGHPCGFLGDPQHPCTCTPLMTQRYRSRLSGPLLDRIDLHINAPRVAHKDLIATTSPDSSATIRARVERARQVQCQRLAGFGLHTNSQMQSRHLKRFCKLEGEGEKLLEMVVDRLGLSARSYSRILKVARTIADLAEVEQVKSAHLAEAIQYRNLDRKLG